MDFEHTVTYNKDQLIEKVYKYAQGYMIFEKAYPDQKKGIFPFMAVDIAIREVCDELKIPNGKFVLSKEEKREIENKIVR